MRYEDRVEVMDEAPKEEEAGDQDQGKAIRLAG